MNDELSKRLEILDNTYSDYLMKKIDTKELEKKIGIILSSLDLAGGKRKFRVKVIKNKSKEPFFGMRIYPEIDKLVDITGDALSKKVSFKKIIDKWETINSWYIEIDDTVFDRITISFIPKELTALTLHEIGHVIYSDKPIEKFYRAYQETYMRMKLSDKASMKCLYMLYTIPLTIACASHNYTNSHNEIKQERFADKMLEDFGYTEALLTAINKIIKECGNNSSVSEEEGNKKIETSMIWCNLNSNDLVRRKNSLKDDLFYNTIKSNSPYIKALSLMILHNLGVGLRENYTGAVVENYTDMMLEYNPENISDFTKTYESFWDLKKFAQLECYIRSATESYVIAMESKRGIIKMPSQYDIDAIYVECDRVDNHSDRIYVLDLIYDKLTQLDQFESSIGENKSELRKYESKIKSMREELQTMRKVVLSKRNFDSEYHLFVKYPKGYEG